MVILSPNHAKRQSVTLKIGKSMLQCCNITHANLHTIIWLINRCGQGLTGGFQLTTRCKNSSISNT